MSGRSGQAASRPSADNIKADIQVASTPRFQISLSLMLMLMVVFAFISAALFYASQVPVIREELAILFYGESGKTGEDAGRLAHRAFILFTFTSPLLLACSLSLILSAMKLLQRSSS